MVKTSIMKIFLCMCLILMLIIHIGINLITVGNDANDSQPKNVLTTTNIKPITAKIIKSNATYTNIYRRIRLSKLYNDVNGIYLQTKPNTILGASSEISYDSQNNKNSINKQRSIRSGKIKLKDAFRATKRRFMPVNVFIEQLNIEFNGLLNRVKITQNAIRSLFRSDSDIDASKVITVCTNLYYDIEDAYDISLYPIPELRPYRRFAKYQHEIAAKIGRLDDDALLTYFLRKLVWCDIKITSGVSIREVNKNVIKEMMIRYRHMRQKVFLLRVISALDKIYTKHGEARLLNVSNNNKPE